MASSKQYQAGVRAVARRDGPAGVKRFFERHGVVFSRSEDGRLAFAYDGPDEGPVTYAIVLMGREDPRVPRGIAALCARDAVMEEAG